MSVSVTSDLNAIESEWRQFEQHADCTPFQTYHWLATWQRCIGELAGVTPAIVRGRGPAGELLFLLPLAVEHTRFVRRLTFLGHLLCDYNAPLLAPDFSASVTSSDFLAIWTSVQHRIQQMAGCQYDLVLLDKMPELIGRQPNPMLQLATTPNQNGAYLTALGADWDTFYTEKRSSATRRRDRTKRKRLAELGEICFVSQDKSADIESTLDVLFAQKSRSFARMGVPDLFVRPGYSEFFVSVAKAGGHFVHVSRLNVGAVCAAANLGLLFRGCYFHILASHHDGPVSRFGPGIVHLHELMRYAIAQGCSRFDFTIGDEQYKSEWADTRVDLYDHVSGNGWRGWLAAVITIGLLRAKRWIKTSPVVWSIASKLRSGLSLIKR